jgi:hypothetical protein
MSTQSQDSAALVAALSAAIAARKSSLAELRDRIASLLSPIPVGAKLRNDPSVHSWPLFSTEYIYITGSQARYRGYFTSTRDDTLIAIGGLHARHEGVCVSDFRYNEGRYQDYDFRWLSGRETRNLALRLPAAIARYMAECEAEREANTETLTA